MKKYFLLTVFTLVATLWANAQNLDKMQWFNEPESYTIKNGQLEMDVPAQTDYWGSVSSSVSEAGPSAKHYRDFRTVAFQLPLKFL